MLAHETEGTSGSSRWPIVALAGLAALAPFNINVTSKVWADLQPRLLAVVALLLVVALAGRALFVSASRPDGVDRVAYFWLAAVWLSALVSDDVGLGAAGAARLTVPILLIPVVRSLVRTRSDARLVARALGTGMVIGVGIGLAVWALGRDADISVFAGRVTELGPFNRLTRPWSHANVAAMALGASLPLATQLGTPWRRTIALGLGTIALVLTVSRGGLLAGCAAATVWVVLRRRRSDVYAAIGLAALGAIVFALSAPWNTRIEVLGDDAFYGSRVHAPAEMFVDASEPLVQVSVTNESATSWRQRGDERVLISARWFGPDGLIWTEDWWELPQDLAPGESVSTGLTVAPRVPDGDYEVRWDLVIPDTAYFGQFLGEAPVLSSATVSGSTVEAGENFRYELVPRQIGIGRVDTWKLAWDDFVSSPLLGVGPNQFGNRAGAHLASDQRAVGDHAHHIVLEPLASWGLLGAVPFFMLGLGGLARAMQRAWLTRNQLTCAVAAGLAAVVIHGMVDWPLVTITTAIPVGVLAGLAWSEVGEP